MSTGLCSGAGSCSVHYMEPQGYYVTNGIGTAWVSGFVSITHVYTRDAGTYPATYSRCPIISRGTHGQRKEYVVGPIDRKWMSLTEVREEITTHE